MKSKGRFNKLFFILCFVWMWMNFIKFVPDVIYTVLAVSEGEFWYLIEPISRLLLVVGFALLLTKKSKTSIALIVVPCVVAFTFNWIVAGFEFAVGSMVGLVIFLLFFFLLKRDGKSAFQVIWGNKKRDEEYKEMFY